MGVSMVFFSISGYVLRRNRAEHPSCDTSTLAHYHTRTLNRVSFDVTHTLVVLLILTSNRNG